MLHQRGGEASRLRILANYDLLIKGNIQLNHFNFLSSNTTHNYITSPIDYFVEYSSNIYEYKISEKPYQVIHLIVLSGAL